MKLKLKWMLLSIIALCSFALSSCGGDSKDDPKCDDLGDGLKTGFYVTKNYGGECSSHYRAPHSVGEKRCVIKILNHNTLMTYNYDYDWVVEKDGCEHSNGTIEFMGKKWHYDWSAVYTYVRTDNKIIVPNWGDGTIMTILPDGSLLKDGFSSEHAYSYVAN